MDNRINPGANSVLKNSGFSRFLGKRLLEKKKGGGGLPLFTFYLGSFSNLV